jgi:AraC-like DNA-binding protein
MEKICIEDGFTLLKTHNKGELTKEVFKSVDKNCLQIHFCIQNSVKLLFNQGNYGINIAGQNSLLLYNPQQELPIHIELDANAKLITLLITIEKFHTFFSNEAGLIHFLHDENKNKKYYKDKELGTDETSVLNQIFNFSLHASLEKLYLKGKVLELISLYFHKPDKKGVETCPFLEDSDNVEKIQKAKNILISKMMEPPSLNELANASNLSLQNLKDGFKQVYGETVFAYLLNYKLEFARKLLASKKYNVGEISFEIGYSTPSHFIAAFKKKYGTTPKKYMSAL